MRSFLVCLWATGMMTGLFLPAARAADNEDAKLTAFFQQYLEEEFRQQPLQATSLGDHRFDHLLDDISAEARAGWRDHYRKTLARLPRHVRYRKLTCAGQIDFEIFRQHLTCVLWLDDNTKPFADDPRVYNEYITGSVYMLRWYYCQCFDEAVEGQPGVVTAPAARAGPSPLRPGSRPT